MTPNYVNKPVKHCGPRPDKLFFQIICLFPNLSVNHEDVRTNKFRGTKSLSSQ